MKLGHALAWWESDATAKRLGNEPLVTKWEVFTDMIQSQLYPIGYEEEKKISWL